MKNLEGGQRFKMYLKTNFSRKLFAMSEIHNYCFQHKAVFFMFFLNAASIHACSHLCDVHVQYMYVRMFILLIIR